MNIMAIPSLFKTPRHRKFDYRPIYYNQQKEELQERIRKIEQEMGVGKPSDSNYKPTIQKGQMRGHFREARRLKKQSNARLLIILLALFALAYFLIYNNLYA
jgi:2'-5' RNA ligase